MIAQLWNFFKNPIYVQDTNVDFGYRLNILFKLVAICIVASIILGLVISSLESLFSLDLGKHAIDDFLENYPLIYLFLGAVVLAPLLEEVIFRGPFVFFKNKPYFSIIFYSFTLVFGFYHITNFEMTATTLLLSPLLVSPQLFVGCVLGFIRVRFGLKWAIGLHACYNLILVGRVILLKVLNIPIE